MGQALWTFVNTCFYKALVMASLCSMQIDGCDNMVAPYDSNHVGSTPAYEVARFLLEASRINIEELHRYSEAPLSILVEDCADALDADA